MLADGEGGILYPFGEPEALAAAVCRIFGSDALAAGKIAPSALGPFARLTSPVRDGTTNLVIGESQEDRIGLLVLDRRAIARAFDKGRDLSGPEGMVEVAESAGLRVRRLRIPEEGTAVAAPPTLLSALLGLFTFTQPRAASAMYGSVFLSIGVGAAGWSLSSFNSTALLHAEGLVTGAALAVAGMLLVTTSLLSNSLALIRKHQRS